MTAVKLSDMMKKRQLLSFELFPPKTDRGMANLSETIQQLCRYNRNIFLLLTEPAVEMLELTVRYAGWSETLGLYRSLILQ